MSKFSVKSVSGKGSGGGSESSRDISSTRLASHGNRHVVDGQVQVSLGNSLVHASVNLVLLAGSSVFQHSVDAALS